MRYRDPTRPFDGLLVGPRRSVASRNQNFLFGSEWSFGQRGHRWRPAMRDSFACERGGDARVSAFEAICCQCQCREPRPGTNGLVSTDACATGANFKGGSRDQNARAATFRDQRKDRPRRRKTTYRESRAVRRGGGRSKMESMVDGSHKDVQWQQSCRAFCGSRPRRVAADRCRAPSRSVGLRQVQLVGPTDRPTARPRRPRRELRSAHGWPCQGPASDRVDRRSRLVSVLAGDRVGDGPRTESVPGRRPNQCRAEDRVSAGPPTESVPGRGPSQCRAADRISAGPPAVSVTGRGPNRRRVEDRTGDGPMTESMAAREPSRRRAGDRVGDGLRTELEAGRGSAGERVGDRPLIVSVIRN
jgi:hypothetical protein